MNEKLTIQDISNLLAEKHGISKRDAEMFIKTIFDLIEETLETDESIKIKGLGTFKLTKVDNRESINVNTGERFIIESHSKISFIPENNIKELINKPFAHFETVILNESTILEDTPEFVEKEVADDEVESENIDSELPEIKKESKIIEIAPEKTLETIIEIQPTEPKKNVDDTIIKNKSVNKSNTFETSKQKSTKTYFIVSAVISIILACFAILAIYMPDFFTKSSLKSLSNETTIRITKSNDESTKIVKADSVNPANDKKISVETIDTTKTVITGVRKGWSSVIPDSTSYTIVGTMTIYKIGTGETLTMVSKHFYETKDLWPYLVKHNKGIITNPDRVPSGTVIRIPALRDKIQDKLSH